MQNIVIIGATSAIAHAAARLWASQGATLFLVARNESALALNADDLRVRGAHTVHRFGMDVTDYTVHEKLIDTIHATLTRIDVVLIAHGTLPDQRACETDIDQLRREIDTNGVSVCALAQRFANQMLPQGKGTIAIISSVAGDRGRQSNYVYGAAKGLVSRFAEGLRNRLGKTGLHVLTIKPGFVDTPMTAGFERKGLLWAQPETIAASILNAIERRRDVAYLPWFWRPIMLIIRHIPESIFKRLSL